MNNVHSNNKGANDDQLKKFDWEHLFETYHIVDMSSGNEMCIYLLFYKDLFSAQIHISPRRRPHTCFRLE